MEILRRLVCGLGGAVYVSLWWGVFVFKINGETVDNISKALCILSSIGAGISTVVLLGLSIGWVAIHWGDE